MTYDPKRYEELPEGGPVVTPMDFLVSALPFDDAEVTHWSLRVRRPLGEDAYVVIDGFSPPTYYTRDDLTEDAPMGTYRRAIPDETEETWKARTRFTFEDAVSLAKALVPRLMVNGMTAAQVVEWRKQVVPERETREA